MAPGLVVRHSHEAAFVVKVPANWVYKDATYPSDHSTEWWRAPGGAARLEVQVSACVGCAAQPAHLVPIRGARIVRLDRWRLRYSKGLRWGLVVVLHDASGIQGFARVDLWLPAAQRALAGPILASFRI